MLLYDEIKLRRQIDIQQSKNWDLESDIEWSQGIDLSMSLLPLDKNQSLLPHLSTEENLVLSQFMGIIIAATISQLEDVSNQLRVPTWEKILDKFPVNPEMYELGNHFYEDEIKHSKAFKRYIEKFSKKIDIDTELLQNILPTSDKSVIKHIYKCNSIAGGMSVWWLIAGVEELSIGIFEYLRTQKSKTDPLYYQIHKLHYEEEIRHKSYAELMLKLNHEFNKAPLARILKKTDFIMAEVLNISWTFHEMFKSKKVKDLKNSNEFFKILSDLFEKNNFNILDVITNLFTTTPFISDTLNLSKFENLRELSKKYGTLKTPNWERTRGRLSFIQ